MEKLEIKTAYAIKINELIGDAGKKISVLIWHENDFSHLEAINESYMRWSKKQVLKIKNQLVEDLLNLK